MEMKVGFIFHYLHKYATIYVHTYIKQWKDIYLDFAWHLDQLYHYSYYWFF